ncbi:hypothetical protein PV797_09040 [Clostridiaceae bacterium M8S5]|nr:hypothetical protein PV797_09040 [Clostridiaceae bacterium M8S5]
MFKINIYKDLILIVKKKYFWIVEIALTLLMFMMAFMLNIGIQDIKIDGTYFILSLPLTIIYSTMTFIPIGDYYREQKNGGFTYLISIGVEIKDYILSKAFVMSVIIYVPSLVFLLVSKSYANIWYKILIVILMYWCSFSMSICYSYEIIYSVNPVKTMGKASMFTIILIILIAMSTKINKNYVNLDVIIAIIYLVNIITDIIFIIKIRNINSDSIICRR